MPMDIAARMGTKPIPRECSPWVKRRLARGRTQCPLEIIDKFAVIPQMGGTWRAKGKGTIASPWHYDAHACLTRQ